MVENILQVENLKLFKEMIPIPNTKLLDICAKEGGRMCIITVIWNETELKTIYLVL